MLQSPAGQRLPPPSDPEKSPLSYMGGIVEQEGHTSPGAVSNEVPCKFVVERHQIREGDRLLHDALVPEQWDRHEALVTGPETLDVGWEAGEILTGALERAHNTVFQLCCRTVS